MGTSIGASWGVDRRALTVGLALIALLGTLGYLVPAQKTPRAEQKSGSWFATRTFTFKKRCDDDRFWTPNIRIRATGHADARQHLSKAYPGCEFRVQKRRRHRSRSW